MTTLLDNLFAPLTYQIGFLEAPFKDVLEVYLNWQSQIGRASGRRPESQLLKVKLPEALSCLQPLTTPPTKVLLVTTRSRWSAYFDNGLRTSDPESAIGHLCTIVPCRGVVAHCVPDRSAEPHPDALRVYGAVTFRIFVPHQTEWLNQERGIISMNDGGRWMFSAEGVEQPFEEPDTYKRRKIRDRFTCDMLERYCGALDIKLFDDHFYLNEAAIVRTIQRLPPGAPKMSLKEAHRRVMLDSG